MTKPCFSSRRQKDDFFLTGSLTDTEAGSKLWSNLLKTAAGQVERGLLGLVSGGVDGSQCRLAGIFLKFSNHR